MHMHCSSKAMIKCMLNSPETNSANDSTLFTNTDFHSLTGLGKNRAAAADAANWMQYADRFLDAYSTLDADHKAKLVDVLEIRMVMNVHGKKSETRSSFSSLVDIASKFYDEANALDTKLPRWNKLPLKQDSAVGSMKTGSRIREISSDTVQDYILQQKGFAVGTIVQKMQATEAPEMYTITSLNKDLKTVTCKPLRQEADEKKKGEKSQDDKEEDEAIEISRFELIDVSLWKKHIVVKPRFLTDIANPAKNFDFQAHMVAGLVKQALASEFEKSSEDNVTLQVAPELKVFAKKAFKKEASLKLIGITQNVAVHAVTKKVDPPWMLIGTGEGIKIYAKSSNVLPDSLGMRTPFVSKYWCVHDTFDQSKVNCKFEAKHVQVKMLDFDLSLELPMIVNNKAVGDEDELVVLRRSPEPVSDEPPNKKAKSAPPKPKGKSKAKSMK